MPAAKITYTPEDEPYLGLESLLHFDNVIISCLEANAKISPYTHTIKSKSDLQIAMAQIIPQAINFALSIRELIRQGYLFGAFALIRLPGMRMRMFLSRDSSAVRRELRVRSASIRTRFIASRTFSSWIRRSPV